MSVTSSVAQFIRGIRALSIPRIEDLPYVSSPPVQFVYESTAVLAAGVYAWADNPSPLTPTRPLQKNAIYFIRKVTLAADVSELDFESAIVTTPQFFTFLKSDAESLLFREPIQMVKFFDGFEFRQAFFVKQAVVDPLSGFAAGTSGDRILAAFRGVLLQTAALLGKADITLKAIMSAQEIVDQNFVNLFRAAYPVPMTVSDTARQLVE